MTMTENISQADITPMDESVTESVSVHWLGYVVRTFLVVLILAAAGGISFYWLAHPPKTGRRRPEVQAALVEVTRLSPQTERVVIHALGTVVPARTVQFAARVAGEVVEVNPQFTPGGQFKQGSVLVRIDPKDFELAVQQQAAQVAKCSADVEQRAGELAQRISDITRAESELAQEMGQQSVAKREYELLGKTVLEEDKVLVLREPQLKSARANCDAARAAKRSAEGASRAAEASKVAAEAALEKAKLDLARTTVRAPFNAMIKERDVDLGSQVTAGSSLASLVGTDKYWVQVSVPLDQLRWIRVPGPDGEAGSSVRVYHESAWGPGVFRKGTVERLMAEVEPQGRMARLLVAVTDPVGLKAPPGQRHPLILDSYVRVEIEGLELPNIIRVDRAALRDGDRVWVMKPNNTLDIRKVTVVWGGNKHVCVSEGLESGDRLVVSDLGAAVPGMALRTADKPSTKTPPPPVKADRAGRGQETRG